MRENKNKIMVMLIGSAITSGILMASTENMQQLSLEGNRDLTPTEVADKIFESGVSKTLEVITYQKKLALQENVATTFNGDYCYELSPENGQKFKEINLIKLEALSLALDESNRPIYYQDKNDNNHLCLFTAKAKEPFRLLKKLIDEKLKGNRNYKDFINKFDAKEVRLSIQKGITPILPSVGKYYIDMSETITLLTSQLSKKREEIKLYKKSLKKLKITIDKTLDIDTDNTSHIKTKKKLYVK